MDLRAHISGTIVLTQVYETTAVVEISFLFATIYLLSALFLMF